MIQRLHIQRGVFYQECIGNALDVGPRMMLKGAAIPDVEEDTVVLTDGTVHPKRRTTALEIPINDSEILSLARLMEEQSRLYGHRVGFIGLSGPSGSHMVFAEPTNLSVQPASAGLRDVANSMLRLETRTFTTPVVAGSNLLSPIPWEDTSTPGAPDNARGIALLQDGSLAATDHASQEVYLYDGWDGDAYRKIDIGAGNQQDLEVIDDDGEEVLAIASYGDSAIRFHRLDGSEVYSPLTVRDTGGSDLAGVAAVTVGDAGNLLVGTQDGTIYEYSSVWYGGASTIDASASYDPPVTTMLSMYWDGSRLLSTGVDSTGNHRLQNHGSAYGSVGEFVFVDDAEGVTASGSDPIVLLSDGSSTIQRHDGVSATVITSSALSVPQPMRIRGSDGLPERGYFGPVWTAQHACSVGVEGIPDTVSSTDNIELTMPFPMGGAEVRLTGVTGELDAQDFGDTALGVSDSSRIGSPPQLLLSGGKYSGLGISSASIWSLYASLESVASRPSLEVVQVGTPRGVLRGGVGSSCVVSPAWAGSQVDAQQITTIHADAGDTLDMSVTEAPGDSLFHGFIDGEGDARQGLSTTPPFEYDTDGDYVPELVSESLDNVVSVTLGGSVGGYSPEPIDLSKVVAVEDLIFRIPVDLATVTVDDPSKIKSLDFGENEDAIIDTSDVAVYENLEDITAKDTAQSSSPGPTINGPFSNLSDLPLKTADWGRHQAWNDENLAYVNSTLIFWTNRNTNKQFRWMPGSAQRPTPWLRSFADLDMWDQGGNNDEIFPDEMGWDAWKSRLQVGCVRRSTFSWTSNARLAHPLAEACVEGHAFAAHDVVDADPTTGDGLFVLNGDLTAQDVNYTDPETGETYTATGVDAFPSPTDPGASDGLGDLWTEAPGERLFLVEDSTGTQWMCSTTDPGSVNGSTNTEVTLGAAVSGDAVIWPASGTRPDGWASLQDAIDDSSGPSESDLDNGLFRDSIRGAGAPVSYSPGGYY